MQVPPIHERTLSDHDDQAASFDTTNWSLVLAVTDSTPGRSFDALGRLCSRYWFPVYASIRRHGNDVHQAQDLTQGFFEFVIEHGLLQRAQRDRGRFRSFLLSSLNNFLHNHHDHATAAKRGGKYRIVPLDDANAEQIFASEPPQTGHSFDRSWAVTLIRRVMENLRAEFVGRGRACRALPSLPAWPWLEKRKTEFGRRAPGNV